MAQKRIWTLLLMIILFYYSLFWLTVCYTIEEHERLRVQQLNFWGNTEKQSLIAEIYMIFWCNFLLPLMGIHPFWPICLKIYSCMYISGFYFNWLWLWEHSEYFWIMSLHSFQMYIAYMRIFIIHNNNSVLSDCRSWCSSM